MTFTLTDAETGEVYAQGIADDHAVSVVQLATLAHSERPLRVMLFDDTGDCIEVRERTPVIFSRNPC